MQSSVNLFIARERCVFINRCALANVAITTTTTITLYDGTKLGNDSKQKPKKNNNKQRQYLVNQQRQEQRNLLFLCQNV